MIIYVFTAIIEDKYYKEQVISHVFYDTDTRDCITLSNGNCFVNGMYASDTIAYTVDNIRFVSKKVLFESNVEYFREVKDVMDEIIFEKVIGEL